MNNYIRAFVVLLIFISCTKKDVRVERWEKRAVAGVEKFSRKPIYLPANLPLIADDKDLTLQKLYDSPLKIISYVDGTCSVCHSEFIFWRDVKQELAQKGLTCDLFIFVHTTDVDAARELLKALKVDIPAVFDGEKAFVFGNELQHDKRLRGALLDQDNKVILIGNPVLNKELRELYFETIEDIERR